MVTEVLDATGLVVTVKDVDEAPPGTVTDAGTWAAAALLLNRLTKAPPGDAGPLRVTMPVEDIPPTTVVGLKLTELKVAVDAVTVRVVVWVTEL
jgi:hypothetical protein